MSVAASRPVAPVLGRLSPANALLGDRAALDAAFARDGYWYFKGVLDPASIEAFRAPILAELKKIGVIDADAVTPVWNGCNMDRFPGRNMAGYDLPAALVKTKHWRDIVAHPANVAFFTAAIGHRPDWLPVAEMRIVPPEENTGETFLYPHQDGFYNEGYRCLTAWMPLWPVPAEAGGLTVAPGRHRHGYLHDTAAPPRFPIPQSDIDALEWSTADYEIGDVVIFDRMLPHSGRHNHTRDLFRVSFDIRCNLPGDPLPIWGHLVSASDREVVVRDEHGAVHRLPMNENTYVRGLGAEAGQRLELAEVAPKYLPGQEVFVTLENGAARLLREPKY